MGLKLFIDNWGGIFRSIESAPLGDDAIVTETQEVGRLLRANARDADVDQTGRHFRRVASVPLAIILKARREGWEHDMAKWKAFLNDPENRAFRIWPGKL